MSLGRHEPVYTVEHGACILAGTRLILDPDGAGPAGQGCEVQRAGFALFLKSDRSKEL